MAMGKPPKNTPYLKLNVASDGDNGETIWYSVTLFGGAAKNLVAETGGRKGGEFKFIGRLTQREYKRADGSLGVSNDFIADSVVLEGGRVIDKFTAVPVAEAKQEEVQPF